MVHTAAMALSDLDYEQWLGLADRDARRLAEEIADRVGAELVEVRAGSYAGRRTRSALFSRDGVIYGLVPGGRVSVGYDGRRFTGTAAQVAEYAGSAEEYGLPADIREFVDRMTSPPRVVGLRPLLVAVEAQEAGLRAVSPEDSRIAELVADSQADFFMHQLPPPSIEWNGRARAELAPDGTVVRAWLIEVPTLAEEKSRLAGEGLRLLTPDEWEHACGAGATTLFRWGDHCPADRYPDGPAALNQEPNAFGLRIAHDPYRDERTADPAVVCGGDGGGMMCGGAGFFLAWLTLATSYRDTDHGDWTVQNDDDPLKNLVRPAIPLT
ncbi:MAG: hypothetical protein JWN52_1495 [Actinomycetia bacterium]|nr:hypothetical protein [Actinomycetes bacterium]